MASPQKVQHKTVLLKLGRSFRKNWQSYLYCSALPLKCKPSSVKLTVLDKALSRSLIIASPIS